MECSVRILDDDVVDGEVDNGGMADGEIFSKGRLSQMLDLRQRKSFRNFLCIFLCFCDEPLIHAGLWGGAQQGLL